MSTFNRRDAEGMLYGVLCALLAGIVAGIGA